MKAPAPDCLSDEGVMYALDFFLLLPAAWLIILHWRRIRYKRIKVNVLVVILTTYSGIEIIK